MLFNRENGKHMDTNDAKEVLAVRALLFLHHPSSSVLTFV
jgi:hypothetical protein